MAAAHAQSSPSTMMVLGFLKLKKSLFIFFSRSLDLYESSRESQYESQYQHLLAQLLGETRERARIVCAVFKRTAADSSNRGKTIEVLLLCD